MYVDVYIMFGSCALHYSPPNEYTNCDNRKLVQIAHMSSTIMLVKTVTLPYGFVFCSYSPSYKVCHDIYSIKKMREITHFEICMDWCATLFNISIFITESFSAHCLCHKIAFESSVFILLRKH